MTETTVFVVTRVEVEDEGSVTVLAVCRTQEAAVEALRQSLRDEDVELDGYASIDALPPDMDEVSAYGGLMFWTISPVVLQ